MCNVICFQCTERFSHLIIFGRGGGYYPFHKLIMLLEEKQFTNLKTSIKKKHLTRKRQSQNSKCFFFLIGFLLFMFVKCFFQIWFKIIKCGVLHILRKMHEFPITLNRKALLSVNKKDKLHHLTAKHLNFGGFLACCC